tara:strand:+ start:415 stop:951 length:537 start_codon:yes stop_codon:yes gene_type:complete
MACNERDLQHFIHQQWTKGLGFDGTINFLTNNNWIRILFKLCYRYLTDDLPEELKGVLKCFLNKFRRQTRGKNISLPESNTFEVIAQVNQEFLTAKNQKDLLQKLQQNKKMSIVQFKTIRQKLDRDTAFKRISEAFDKRFVKGQLKKINDKRRKKNKINKANRKFGGEGLIKRYKLKF